MKFTDNDMCNYNLMKSEADKPCLICGDDTKYIEYCSEGRMCSKLCHDKFYDLVGKNESI